MKTMLVILLTFASIYSADKVSITSDINSVFLHNHKSFGEFIRDYGSPTSRYVKIVKQYDVLTEKEFELPKVVYVYSQFTYMGKGNITIKLDVTEDHLLGDHTINDIVIFIENKPYRHFYKY